MQPVKLICCFRVLFPRGELPKVVLGERIQACTYEGWDNHVVELRIDTRESSNWKKNNISIKWTEEIIYVHTEEDEFEWIYESAFSTVLGVFVPTRCWCRCHSNRVYLEIWRWNKIDCTSREFWSAKFKCRNKNQEQSLQLCFAMAGNPDQIFKACIYAENCSNLRQTIFGTTFLAFF